MDVLWDIARVWLLRQCKAGVDEKVEGREKAADGNCGMPMNEDSIFCRESQSRCSPPRFRTASPKEASRRTLPHGKKVFDDTLSIYCSKFLTLQPAVWTIRTEPDLGNNC